MIETISPDELLRLYFTQDLSSWATIDVRSEGEFSSGFLPNFCNFPILPNDLRAAVGTCYKNQGKLAAIELGHKLVAPIREGLIASWLHKIAASPQKKAIVHCWRGGLRSKISCEWMVQNGGQASVLVGGYKAFRGLLLAEIAAPKKLIILSGPTGSNKTSLLTEFHENAIDLEANAHHRGSSFGLALGARQPSQQTFENAIGLEFAKRRGQTILLEDESKLIGHCYLGPELFGQMLLAPRVVLQVAQSERIENIVKEYVLAPLSMGFLVDDVREHLLLGLSRLKKNLGGLIYEQVRLIIANIPEIKFFDMFYHHQWVELILSNYYDKAYAYSFAKTPKTLMFAGTRAECREFLQANL